MSTGFLIAESLSTHLRKSYQRGDMKVTLQYLVGKLKLGEYRVMLKRNFDTACWIPPVGKRGSHSIYYGDRMLARIATRFAKVNGLDMPDEKAMIAALAEEAKSLNPDTGLKITKGALRTKALDAQFTWLKEAVDEDKWNELLDLTLQAVVSYGRHEREHARQTNRDLNQVNRDLRVLGIPFMYFNLFEDARIEGWSREELGCKFDWTVLEDLAPMDNPVNLFLRCIQMEGQPDTEARESDEAYPPNPDLTVGHVAEDVSDYYLRACACTTSEQLYPIIVEFLKQFKDDLPKPDPDKSKGGKAEDGSGSGGGGGESSDSGEGDDGESDSDAEERAGDLSVAAEAAEKGDDFLEEFESDTEVVGGTDEEGKAAEEKAKEAIKAGKPSKKGGGPKSKDPPASITPEGASKSASEVDFLAPNAGELDDVYAKRVADLTAMLMRMFKVHSLPAATENPGQRLSSRHLARGELRFIHKRVFGGKGKRKFSIVYDCSGSMSGRPDREGKLFLLALNNLAKMGYLEGNLILSGWVGRAAGWLSYSFPVADEVILRISPTHSSEGLQDSLKDNLAKVKGMDDVFVYTDANICDRPLDRDFFAKHKVWPVGLYVGSTTSARLMEQHFPQNIIKDTIEQIAECLLTRNRRTVG